MRVLVVNAGSSSVKLSLLDADDTVIGHQRLAATAGVAGSEELARALERLDGADAVGHRVVHGGPDFTAPVRLDEAVVRRLRELTDLAPLHQPKSLAGIDAVGAALPGTPAVACFDTAFHAGLPAAAAAYALPEEWRSRYRIRRYGFHGLAHAYAARRAAELSGGAAGRLVVAHLGAGASLAAVRDGASVDTTMGFTPLEGLVMATRSGSVDPGLVLWLVQHAGIAPARIAQTLEHESGLLGLAGTADMREVLAAADRGEEPARLGLEVYLHRLRAGIAAMAASLGGLDALVFTGGVGEASAAVRAGAAEGLRFLGVAVDAAANGAADTGEADAEIGAAGARVRTFAIAAREDLEIAREVREVLGAVRPRAAAGG
ncbi:acetate/propionate family kinase [Allonocardiopsis opalescens]|uniref:Acetate kinase n=1 Tax=Allonocardiopsis opalescens TaxID=1144618 RepID=A0A2T0PTV8_9ACTN|nr:acetate/propionate family kinase [Allonocardiopsis opalescens]PRX92156.1 acetate kinase [Allonocardiopsis opalescens]